MKKDVLKTNADHIRNMSDDELARFLTERARCNDCIVNAKGFCPSLSSCYYKHLEWLQSEADAKGNII